MWAIIDKNENTIYFSHVSLTAILGEGWLAIPPPQDLKINGIALTVIKRFLPYTVISKT